MDAAMLTSICRWRLDAIDYENINRSFRSFEPEAQLVLDGREQRRRATSAPNGQSVTL
jgi:hypothetical protein